jgi:hypothetical protein
MRDRARIVLLASTGDAAFARSSSIIAAELRSKTVENRRQVAS